MLEKAELRDVAVSLCLQPSDDVRPSRLAKEMRVAFLEPEILLNRHALTDLADRRDLAVFCLEHREEPALRRETRHLDGVGRVASPPERARDQDVEITSAVECHGTLNLVFDVTKVSNGRSRDVRDLVRHGDHRHVLPLAKTI